MIKANELVFKLDLDDEDGKIIWRSRFGYEIHDDFDYGDPPRQIFCLYVNGRIKNTFRNFSDAVTWAKQNFQILTENRIDKEHFRNLIKEAIEYGFMAGKQYAWDDDTWLEKAREYHDKPRTVGIIDPGPKPEEEKTLKEAQEAFLKKLEEG